MQVDIRWQRLDVRNGRDFTFEVTEGGRPQRWVVCIGQIVNHNICFNIRYGRGAHCASACISPNYCLSQGDTTPGIGFGNEFTRVIEQGIRR